MLGKLIKYDLKALAKILAPLWGVLLVMGLIFGISIRSNLEGIGNTMIVFSLVVIVAVIVAIFVMNVIVVIQRFWKGLLQEEGYLMFTLPVTTRSLILSKVISALIISCGTALVISLLGVEIIAISPVKLMDTVTYFGNWVIKVHAAGLICIQKYRCSCAFPQMQEQRYFIAPLSFSFAALRAYIPSKSESPAGNTEKSRSWCGLRLRRTTAASGSCQYRRWPSEPQ